MLDNIIKFSIKNKLIIGVMTLLLIIWGVWSATKLPIDAQPDITNNQVQVITLSGIAFHIYAFSNLLYNRYCMKNLSFKGE